jgi:hypothetical protein
MGGKKGSGDTTLETRGESFSESEVPPARTTTWKSISGETAVVEGVAGPLDSPLTAAFRLTSSASVRGGNRGGEDEAAKEDSKTESCAVAAWQAAASVSSVGSGGADAPMGSWGLGDSGGLGLQLPNWAFSLSSGRAFVLCNELGHWGYVVLPKTDSNT